MEFNIPFQHKYGYIRDETVSFRMPKQPSNKYDYISEQLYGNL